MFPAQTISRSGNRGGQYAHETIISASPCKTDLEEIKNKKTKDAETKKKTNPICALIGAHH